MKSRQFGRTPWSVSEIGFGAWAIGGTGVALLNLVFGSGGTWFDPVLPLLVLALIVWYVRGQSMAPAASAVPSRES